MVHKDKIIEFDPSVTLVREDDPQETPLLWRHIAERSLQFKGIPLSAESDFKLVLCDDDHGMSSCSITVYPRVNEGC